MFVNFSIHYREGLISLKEMEFEEKIECDIGIGVTRKQKRIRVPKELRPLSIVVVLPDFNMKECWLQSMIPIESFNDPGHRLFANRNVFVRLCTDVTNWADLPQGHCVLFVNCLNPTVKRKATLFLEKYIPLIFGKTARISTSDCMLFTIV